MMRDVRGSAWILTLAVLFGCTTRPASTPGGSGGAAGPPPQPTPTATPQRASDNPEDVRARMPLRPTPFQHETKFPPPQQSAEEEERTSNAPVEPDLLHGEPALLLNGQPFPARRPYDPKFPEARRMRFVSADASGAGDGSAERPWKDLQDALCRLEPGDRLAVASGIYTGAFRVAGPCRSGTAEAPIQVFARHAFLKAAEGGAAVLTLERAHWQLWEVQIALLDSESPGLVIQGPEAHDISMDQSHIYEGEGPAVLVRAGSDRVTLSNCHIHQSQGVRVEGGASRVTLLNNHIHHNRAASVTLGGGGASAGPPREIRIEGNRIHNDKGPALDLSACDGLSVSRNRFSNYRPDPEEGRTGEAVLVRSGCRNATLADNSVLEASIAVRVGPASPPGGPPERILFSRNYFQNRLTADSTAFALESGRDIRVANNVIDGYAEPFRVGSAAREVSVVNNLVLGPKTAFRVAAPESIAVFDFNVFGGDSSLPREFGKGSGASSDAAKARMSHTRFLQGAGFSDGDLGKVVGFSPVDAGTPVEGVNFEGGAPDIGVAEK